VMWTTGGLDSSTFDSDAKHVLGQEWLSTQKVLMVVSSTIPPMCQAVEPVEVQLTLKRREFGLPKVSLAANV
jgi:hypothetical protein